jgi:hypothetical protein
MCINNENTLLHKCVETKMVELIRWTFSW